MSYTDREPRRSVELDVHMKDFSFIKTTEESAVNLSPGGAFIKMDDPYPSGTLVKFKIRTPDDSVIDGVGKVAWLRKKEAGDTEPSGVGIKFLKMSDEGRNMLEKVLETATIIASEPPSPPSEEKLESKVPKPRSSAPPPEAKTSKAPTSKTSVAPNVKTSVAPATKTSAAPSAAKTSVAPGAAKTSVAPKKEGAEAARPSRPSAPAQAYNSKKTVTISFPPKAEIPATQRPSADEIAAESVSVGAATSPTAAEPSTPVSEKAADALPEKTSPVELTESMQKDREPEEPASTDTFPAPTKTAPAAPKPASSTPVIIGIAVVAALAVSAYFFMEKGEGPTAPKTTPAPATAAPEPEPASPPPSEMKPAVQEAPAAAVPEGAGVQEGAATPEGATPEGATQTPEGATAAAEPAPPAVDVQTVALTTLPPGGTITVNGTAQEGVTPISVNLEKGKEAVITAHIAGYLTQTVPFTPSEEAPALEIDMVPARIKFQMNSTPAGARIIIDGKFNGTTPYTFLRKKYKPDYQYKIEKKGFQSIEGTIAEDQWVEEGRYYVFTLDAVLSPN